MLRYLPGLILIQAAAVAMILFVVDMAQPFAWAKVLAVLAILTLIVSFWFDAMARHQSREEVAELRNRFAQERERIKVRAEREKHKATQASQQQFVKESARVHSRANMKVGASLAGAAGFGVLMLVIEAVTIGMMTLFTAGGAMGGYLLRGTQDAQKKRDLKVIESK